jgi:ribonuclease HI
MPNYECQVCKKSFSVPDATLQKYPAWRPKQCRACYTRRGGSQLRSSIEPRSSTELRPSISSGARSLGTGRIGARIAERVLSPADVLSTYSAGPKSGVFTDGAAHPNPGAGGWGAVHVVNDEIRAEASGHEPHTTNNRMELMALIRGYALVPAGERTTVYTDSRLCVNTINLWAAGWRKNGWKRKGGDIKNLDLVEQLYTLALARPEIELTWIRSHNGYRWNEYADALATSYRRQ